MFSGPFLKLHTGRPDRGKFAKKVYNLWKKNINNYNCKWCRSKIPFVKRTDPAVHGLRPPLHPRPAQVVVYPFCYCLDLLFFIRKLGVPSSKKTGNCKEPHLSNGQVSKLIINSCLLMRCYWYYNSHQLHQPRQYYVCPVA